MDTIDVHDLPEEQAQLLVAFVAFLRQHRQEAAGRDALVQEQGWAAVAEQSFATYWDNEDDAIYDHWREHYHV